MKDPTNYSTNHGPSGGSGLRLLFRPLAAAAAAAILQACGVNNDEGGDGDASTSTPERHLPAPGQRGHSHQRHTTNGTAANTGGFGADFNRSSGRADQRHTAAGIASLTGGFGTGGFGADLNRSSGRAGGAGGVNGAVSASLRAALISDLPRLFTAFVGASARLHEAAALPSVSAEANVELGADALLALLRPLVGAFVEETKVGMLSAGEAVVVAVQRIGAIGALIDICVNTYVCVRVCVYASGNQPFTHETRNNSEQVIEESKLKPSFIMSHRTNVIRKYCEEGRSSFVHLDCEKAGLGAQGTFKVALQLRINRYG